MKKLLQISFTSKSAAVRAKSAAQLGRELSKNSDIAATMTKERTDAQDAGTILSIVLLPSLY